MVVQLQPVDFGRSLTGRFDRSTSVSGKPDSMLQDFRIELFGWSIAGERIHSIRDADMASRLNEIRAE
jgi:hypothetical protein